MRLVDSKKESEALTTCPSKVETNESVEATYSNFLSLTLVSMKCIPEGVPALSFDKFSIENEKRMLSIRYQVLNKGYEKHISMIYTNDDWVTSHWLPFGYDCTRSAKSAEFAGVDEFIANISTDFLQEASKGECNFIDLKFAVKYSVNGQDFWDNNENQNHHLRISRC